MKNIDILNNLNRSETVTYFTENSTKSFECKNNGYVDDIKIEGKTVKSGVSNLYQVDEYTETSSINYEIEPYTTDSDDPTDAEITVEGVASGVLVSTSPINGFEIGKTYTMIFNAFYPDVSRGTCTINADSVKIYQDNVEGFHVKTFVASSTSISFDFNVSYGTMNVNDIMVFEGDHSGKELSYFNELNRKGEYLTSVGQGDKIHIIVENYDNTKADKQIIPTTLRGLPNGVKDTIEKRGNKYVKVQRCEEVTFNGSELISTSDIADQTNTLVVDIYKANITGLSKTNELTTICDKFPSTLLDNQLDDVEGCCLGGLNQNYIRIRISKSRLSTPDGDGFKDWIKKNQLTVAYELAEPKIIELPNFNPQVFEGTNTLSIDSGEVSSDIQFSVSKGIRNELDILKDKVSDVNIGYNQKFKITNDDGSCISISLKNLNDIKYNGQYIGNNMSNAPDEDWYFIEVLRFNDSHIVQRATSSSTSEPKVYIRSFYSGAWNSWRSL